ncbi:MAG: hypothetical protein Q9187_004628 [Circinaria calcarea]
MRNALKELGYGNVYHMLEVIQNPPDAVMWKEAFEAKCFGRGKKYGKAEWDALLGDYGACVDYPSAAFMPELIAAYPKAKVIVSMRNPDAWYTSCMNSVGKFERSFFLNIFAYLDPFLFGRLYPFINVMLTGTFGESKFQDEAKAKSIYVAMHEEVRQMVPEDRLLEYKLGQGWEPLCKFLDKDIPPKPFPHVNESAEFAERQKLSGTLAMRRIAKRLLPSLLGVVAVIGSYLYIR